MQNLAIKYVIGDATEPIGEGRKVIVHVVNDIGKWGAGFTKALSKKWPDTERVYRLHYTQTLMNLWYLGYIFTTKLGDDDNLRLFNIVGQKGVYHSIKNPIPVKYDAIRTGLEHLYEYVKYREVPYAATVHMPRIGCGLARGDWSIVEAIINEELVNKGIPVTVYDLK